MPVIALDLGGTKLAAAIISNEGELLFTETIPLQKRAGDDAGNLVVQEVNSLLKKAGKKNLSIDALGICVPGIVYAKSGKVWAPNIAGWEDYPLLAVLRNGIADKNVTIKIDSDRACYILGEVWKGNAQNCSDAIFLSVGTGIGAGILANNQVLRGTGDIAGAIGWMALDKPFQDKFISCGCFEYNASGEGIVKVMREQMAGNTFSGSTSVTDKNGLITARDVFEACENGDRLSETVIDNAIEYWGMAVANLVSLFNPEKIIFGGGVFGPALRFLDDIYQEAKKWAQPVSMLHVKLEGSALGGEAGLFGAGYLALKG